MSESFFFFFCFLGMFFIIIFRGRRELDFIGRHDVCLQDFPSELWDDAVTAVSKSRTQGEAEVKVRGVVIY